MSTVESQHFLAGSAHVLGDDDAEAPWRGRSAPRQQISSGLLKLLEARERDDETRERGTIGALRVRRIALERGTHVLARRREQTGIVHQAVQKRVEGFHEGTCAMSWIIAGKLIPNTDDARCHRSLSLRTNLRPDQVSSTAQTFTSTSPNSSPKVRTTPSVRSVSTPDVFFGQATQSIPFGSSLSRSGGNPFTRSAF